MGPHKGLVIRQHHQNVCTQPPGMIHFHRPKGYRGLGLLHDHRQCYYSKRLRRKSVDCVFCLLNRNRDKRSQQSAQVVEKDNGILACIKKMWQQDQGSDCLSVLGSGEAASQIL